MLKPVYVLIPALLYFMPPANAATKLKIEDQGHVTITLSKKEHTRVAVKGDRISQIFGSDERLQVELDEVLGQVFLTPHGELGGNGMRITFITEKGLTQDVQLIVSSQGSGAVMLEPVGLVQPNGPQADHTSLSHEEEMTALMNALGGDKVPDGYAYSYLQEETKCEISPDICLTPLASLNGTEFQATLFHIENRADEDFELHHALFANIGHVALGLTKQTLKGGERTFLYTVSAKGEKS